MPKAVRIYGTDGTKPAEVDDTSGFLIGLDSIHSRIHQGIFFQATHLDLALGAAAFTTLLIRVPTGTEAHMRFLVAATADMRAELFENTVVSVDGTIVPAINRNRNSALIAASSILTGSTLTADGDLLADALIPGGAGPNAPGGAASDSFEEWNLSETCHCLRVTNLASQTQGVSITMGWYEPSLIV